MRSADSKAAILLQINILRSKYVIVRESKWLKLNLKRLKYRLGKPSKKWKEKRNKNLQFQMKLMYVCMYIVTCLGVWQ
jgi:hypothetical protein